MLWKEEYEIKITPGQAALYVGALLACVAASVWLEKKGPWLRHLPALVLGSIFLFWVLKKLKEKAAKKAQADEKAK